MDLHLDPEEHRDEADRLLLRVVRAQPYGGLAGKTKGLHGGITSHELLPPGPAAVRGDVAAAVHGCAQRGRRLGSGWSANQ